MASPLTGLLVFQTLSDDFGVEIDKTRDQLVILRVAFDQRLDIPAVLVHFFQKCDVRITQLLCKELFTTFSGIPTSIGDLFLTADATLAPPEPPESSPARQLQALPTTRDDSIPASHSNLPLD